MLTYNTRLKTLPLPEYGRNLQRMVDHCMSLPTREERNECATSIVLSMKQLFPELKQPENAHKVWDHLAIMSGFQLDIDYPEGVVTEADLATAPERVEYPSGEIRQRHYGKITQKMIERIVAMPEGEERDAATMLMANQMKKQMLAINSDGVDDRKVFADLAAYSHGEIRLDPETHRLHEFQEMPRPQSGKKKKKKK